MFIKQEKNNITYFTHKNTDLHHAWSSRGLDMRNTLDRELFCTELGFNYKKLIIPNQQHTNNIALIKNENDLNQSFELIDGIITSLANVPIMLMFADCVPVMIYDKKNKVMALLHAGWRGTAAQITQKAVELMKKEFETEPEELKCFIGAAIGQCCYEVSEEVAKKLLGSLSKKHDNIIINNKIDLKMINFYQLKESGAMDINVMDYCTSCNNDLFYSYRSNHKTPKRHCMVAEIKNNATT